jgi:DNA-binding protein H-NS
MRRPDPLKTIARRIKDLQARAEKIQRSQQEGMDQLRAIIQKYGLKSSHVRSVLRDTGMQRSIRSTSKVKAAPKYRSPFNSAIVWSGRGRPPSWIVSELKSGKSIEDLLIRGTPEEAPPPGGEDPLALSKSFRQAHETEPTSPATSNADGCAR